jgi:phage terminase small subunit
MDLSGDAAVFWDQVAAWLVEHGQCQRIDAFALESMCRLWACTRAALIAAELSPLDKDIRIAATSYAQRFESISARFGMTPVDRARMTLRAAESTEKPVGKARFFKVVG